MSTKMTNRRLWIELAIQSNSPLTSPSAEIADGRHSSLSFS